MAFGLVGWGFILGAAGVITLIAALVQILQTRSFAGCSESVTGTVAGKYVHSSKGRRHYSIDATYTVDGTAYKRSVPITSSEYDTLQRGDPFELMYKPDKPKKVIRPDNLTPESAKKVRIIAIVGGAMTVLGAALFYIGSL